MDNLKFNIIDAIPKISRKKFLKSIFGIISGMSYANSIFRTLVNFFIMIIKQIEYLFINE